MSDIKARRNSLLKSSLSIDSIRNTVVNFTKGLVRSKETASEIAKRTNENNKFKRTLISNDNSYFEKRRENARRRQREDELEASTVQGSTKRQGSIVTRSTKGFLGRILDFFGIVLIGWFVNTLPSILKAIKGLIDRIRGAITLLTNFMDSIGDFLTGIGSAISNAFQSLSSIDLLSTRRDVEEQIDQTNNNLTVITNDLLKTGLQYENPENYGLTTTDGNESLFPDEDEKKADDNEEENKEQKLDENTDKVEGEGNESFKLVGPSVTPPESNNKQQDDDPNDTNLIQGLKDQKEVKNIESKDAQSKGETIDNKNEENNIDKTKRDEEIGFVSGLKGFMSDFFGGEGKIQSDKLKEETTEKKDASGSINSAIASIRKILPDSQSKKDEKVTPKRRIRGNVNTRRNKNRNQVIIVEKEVSTPASGSAPSSSGTSGTGLNSLDGFSKDGAKAAMRKIQTIILG